MRPGVNEVCSFYHEGGHGERRWVIGWRTGVVLAVPVKGSKRGMIQIELQTPRYEINPDTREVTARPFERVWIPEENVNQSGDTIYHGRKTLEVLQERKEAKAEEQARVDKRRSPRRFSR